MCFVLFLIYCICFFVSGFWGTRSCWKIITDNNHIVWCNWFILGRICTTIFSNHFYFGSRCSTYTSCMWKYLKYCLTSNHPQMTNVHFICFILLQIHIDYFIVIWFQVAVPPWPIYRRKPLNWQKPKNIENDDSKKKKKWFERKKLMLFLFFFNFFIYLWFLSMNATHLISL